MSRKNRVSPITTDPPTQSTSTTDPPTQSTGTTDPPTQSTGTTDPPTQSTSTTDPPTQSTGITDPPTQSTGTTDPPTQSTSTTDPPTQSTGTTDPPTQSTGTTDPPTQSTGTTDPPTQSTGTTDPPTQSTSTTDPPTQSTGTTDPPTQSTGTTDPPTQSTGTTDPPTQSTSTTDPPTQSTGTTDPPTQSTSTTDPPTQSTSTTDPPTQSTGTTDPPTQSTGTTDPPTQSTSTTDPPTQSTGITDPPTQSTGTTDPPTQSTSTTDPPTQSTGTTDPPTQSTGTTDPPTQSTSTTDPPTQSTGTTDPPTQSTGTTDPPTQSTGTTDPPTQSTSTTDPPTQSTGTTDPPTQSTGTTDPPTQSTSTTDPPTQSTGTTDPPTRSTSTTDPPKDTLNIVVCGDFDESPIIVSIPSSSSVVELKEKLQQENKLTIYFNGKELPEKGESLKDCGVKNGSAVYLAIKPVKVNVYRPDVDFSFVVEIPQKEIACWKVSYLREIVCSKFGIDINSPHILAVAGEELMNEKMINNYPTTETGYEVTFTVLQHAILQTPEVFDERKIAVAVNDSLKELSEKAFYKRELCSSPVMTMSKSSSASSWTISVQLARKCMFRKNPEIQLPLKECQCTPVFKLRELIQNKLSILPHQQKLTAGTTVLEDWDEDGKVLLLCNYPSIYDGVTIELVRVTEGVHVKLSDYDEKKPVRISQKNVTPSSTKQVKICLPEYINIPNPEEMTVHTLMNIMENCGEDISEGKIYKQNRFACAWGCTRISKNSSSSVKSVSNGCMLMKTKKPSGWLDRKSKKKEQNEIKRR